MDEDIWFDCEDEEVLFDDWDVKLAGEGKGDRLEDGGGTSSSADWSKCDDMQGWFADLKHVWSGRIAEWKLGDRLQQGFVKGGPGLLSQEEIGAVRQDVLRFLSQRGIEVSDRIEQGQPFALDIIRGLLQYCGDVDVSLPGILAEGIGTGIWERIPAPGVFPPEDREASLR